MSIPDNYDLYRAHEVEQERALERCPICEYCKQPITDEKACRIDDEWWHSDCFVDQFETYTEFD